MLQKEPAQGAAPAGIDGIRFCDTLQSSSAQCFPETQRHMTEHQPPPSPPPAKPEDHKQIVQQVLIGVFGLVVLFVILRWTTAGLPPEEGFVQGGNVQLNNANSAEPTPPPPPIEEPPTEEESAVASPFETRVSIETLADDQPGWLTIRTQAESAKRSTAVGHYEEQNEFRIETTNVASFRIDLSALPVLKGKKLIMHIDKQHMSVSLKKQRYLTFGVSPAGSWFVDSGKE